MHIIYFTNHASNADWLFNQLHTFDDVESTTCVTNADQYMRAAQLLRDFSVVVGQLHTREYCIAESILQAEGITPDRRIISAPIQTAEFLRWASENNFDNVIDITHDISRAGHIVHKALIASHGTANIPTPLISGSLTYRDRADESIVTLIAIGYTNAEIAEKLNFSLQTIRNRISQILEASGARNRTHLAAMYLIPHALTLQHSHELHQRSTTTREHLTL